MYKIFGTYGNVRVIANNTNNLVWDTMVAAHEIYSDLPKDLGTLISMYTNLPYMKELIHEKGLDSRWKYNAMDALANIHIMDGEMAEMKALKQVYDEANFPEMIANWTPQTTAGGEYLARITDHVDRLRTRIVSTDR